MTTFEHPRPPLEAPERPEGAPVRTPPRDPADAWAPWGGFLALIGAFVVVLFGGLLASIVAAAFGAGLDDPPAGLNIGLTFFQGLAFIGAALVMAQLSALPRATDFGLRPGRGIVRAGLIMLGVFVAFFVLSAIWVEILGESPDEELPDELGADDSDVALVFVLALVCIMAPVGEEFFFRGFLFRALRNWRGVVPAALIGGATFGAIHAFSADVIALLPLALLGIGLCLLYHWTDSLYPCIALHAINNAIAFSVSQDWDWQIPIVIVGAVTASLGVAKLLGRGIDSTRTALEARAAAPG